MSGPTTGARRRERILVVEDDPDVLHMIATMLKSRYDVVLATDGQQALESIRRGPAPDLVISDVMMPRVDGMALVSALKADPKTATIPIVLLTARTDPGSVIAGINAGARHYLIKPFKPDELLGKIQKALGR